LSVKNPNTPASDPLRQPQEILEKLRDLDRDADEVMRKIANLIV
jgi:hypothetical protein